MDDHQSLGEALGNEGDKNGGFTVRDLIYISGFLVTIATQWGIQRWSVARLEEDVREIRAQTAKLPAYEQAFKTIEVMYQQQGNRITRLEAQIDRLRGDILPFIEGK